MVKTENRKLVEKYCGKNIKVPSMTLAKLMLSEHPKMFNNLEHARILVRQVRGLAGEHNRKFRKDKSLYKDPEYNYSPQNTYLKNKDSKEYKLAQKRKLSKSKYYIVTWAQNNTAIHKEFWENLQSYAKLHNAEIVVILGRYRNPTSLMGVNTDEHWAKELVPYSTANRQKIHKHLQILGDIKVQPTASNPLTGLEGITGLDHCIVGHPKQALDTVPALEGYTSKFMLSTGAITQKNYTDSKAGKVGSFHHHLGFIMVEIKDNEIFYIRQVTALSNGSFTDLCYNVLDKGIKKIKEISSATLGDIHVGDDCPLVHKSQLKWLNYFKPKYTFIHDIFNGTSVNHHNEQDPILRYEIQKKGLHLIANEVERMMQWIDGMKQYGLVFVASNHNDWLCKYIKRKDWRYDLPNAETYMEYSKILLSGKAPKGLIAYLIDQRFGKQCKTLGRNESFTVNGVEQAIHGDKGNNGAKGSINTFIRLSTKITTADSHVLRRKDGVFYVGTSTKLRVGYNQGGSSWGNGDVICHKDGKRQHIIYMGKDKNFTTFVL